MPSFEDGDFDYELLESGMYFSDFDEEINFSSDEEESSPIYSFIEKVFIYFNLI